MSTRMRDLLMGELGQLRYEPTEKRIRGTLGDRAVIDSTRAMLVWEPKRVVPTYAVPVEDIDGDISTTPPAAASRWRSVSEEPTVRRPPFARSTMR